MTPDDRLIIEDAMRRLTKGGQLVLERLAKLADGLEEARPAQVVAASKMLLEYTLGKPSAAASAKGGGAAAAGSAFTSAAGAGFDLSLVPLDLAPRYLEALREVVRVEDEIAARLELDGPKG
jgi:hypothetical protein